MLNPAPSVARCAVTTLTTGLALDVEGSGRGMRGRTSVLSTVIAGITNRLLSGEQQTLSGGGCCGGVGHGLVDADDRDEAVVVAAQDADGSS